MMPNCTGTCATVQNTSGGVPAGTGIVFRGGDAWHFGASTSPAAGGTWAFNTGQTPNGTSSNPLYFGVDTTWYTGGAWVRPILTADNPLCNASTVGTLSDGATCTGTTDTYGQPSYYVSACGYQVGTTNDIIDATYRSYYIFDNFEMTGLCQSSVGQPAHHDEYFSYGSIQAPVTFLNLYIHGASHLQFAGLNGSGSCTGSTVCTNIFVFTGGSGGGATYGETVQNTVVDFSDSDPGGEGLCFGGFWSIAQNVFRYTTQCLPNPLHLFHDNLYEYFFENGHSNLMENIGEMTGANAIYNNVFRHIETYVSSGGGVLFWGAPPSATTDYWFNNLTYDVGALEYFNVGGTSGNNALGNYTLFNNTFQSNASQAILRCASYTNGNVTDTNNHYIDNQTYILGPCSTLTTTTALLMSNSIATTDGYTSAQTYAYSPTAGGSPTVGQGTNEYSTYCTALGTAGLAAAQTACESDTGYACTYNSTNHTVSCPTRTANIRPTSAVWDIGAYEYAASSGAIPRPGIIFAVQ
jgi:hypothetical protein